MLAQHDGCRATAGVLACRQWPTTYRRDGDILSAVTTAGHCHADSHRAGPVLRLRFVSYLRLLLELFGGTS